MKLTIDGREREIADDEFRRLTNKEVMAIEAATGLGHRELFEYLDPATPSSSMLATTAFIWVMLRRETPDLRFDDVEFDLASMDTGDDADPPTPTDSELSEIAT